MSAASPFAGIGRTVQQFTVKLGVYGRMRGVTVTAFLEDVDGMMAVVHAIARHRLGDRLYGKAHFTLMPWADVRGAYFGSWGERAAVALCQSLPVDQFNKQRWLPFLCRTWDERAAGWASPVF